jgi:RNA polymerase sigma-70 factor (family 1)
LLQNGVHTLQDPLLLFRQGREEGFEHFFTTHYLPLTYFAQRLLKSREAAEDVVEDSFIKLWERRQLLESTAAIRGYLYATVRNACIDLLRREKRKVVYLHEAALTAEKEEPPLINRVIAAETMHLVYVAVEALPPKCGQVFKLFYLEGKSLNEIAEQLGIATTTVISQKKRALELLRKKLPPQAYLLLLCLLH